MSAQPRILLPDYPVMVSTRIEEGLPLAAKPLLKLIIWSVLARAQFLFGIEVHHAIIMGNHFHMLLRVLAPDTVAAFMDYFKTETAHAINRLLGRRKRTVWEDGYCALPILTLDDVVKEIIYLYTNPQKADLESVIELYPNLSTWQMFQSGNFTKTVPYIRRNAVRPIEDFHSEKEENEHYQRLLTTADSIHSFTLSPNSWMALFGVSSEEEIAAVNDRIVSGVRTAEAELEETRQRNGKKVLGADALRKQPINKPYTPKKFSKKMWCVCSDLSLRIQFIQFIQQLIAEAREVTRLWKMGDLSRPFPLGLFPPRFPRLANLRPAADLCCSI